MIKIDIFIKYIIIILMILMPILDTTFFYNRITTLAIILTIFFCLLLTLINNKKSRKPFFYIFIYYIICLIYLIINYKHSINFTSLIPGNFNYNFYLETTTILKLITPITLLFILKYNNITKKEYFSIIKYWIIIIGGSIIITNIFKISLSSYGSNYISYSIFEWEKNIYYSLTASKGFFNYANQEACIMIMLLVLSIYMFFEQNKKNIIFILILTISMIMLGTRISTLGGLLVLIFISIFITLYKKIINKEKVELSYTYILIPIITWLLLIPISPYSNRYVELLKDFNDENYIAFVTNITEKDLKKELTEEDLMRKYVDDNYIEEKLPSRFFKKIYSYEYDPKFWYELIKNNNINDINYRMLEINIINRIKEIDNRKTNILFGISNSRIQNVVNIERDFILQYNAYGIIGMLILLLIYPILIIYLLKEIIKGKKIITTVIMFSLILFIIISYLSGNIINFLTPTIPLIFIISYVFIEKRQK